MSNCDIPQNVVDLKFYESQVLSYVLLLNKLLVTKDPSEKPAGCAYFISDGSPIDNFEFLKPLCIARGRKFPDFVVPVELLFCLSTLFEWMYYFGNLFGLFLAPPLTRAEVAKVGITHYFSIKNAEIDFGYKPIFDSLVGSERLGQFYKDFPQDNFFQFAHWIWYILVLLGLTLLGLTSFLPDEYLHNNEVLALVLQLGLYIFQSKFGLQILFYCAILTHFLEAVFSCIIAIQLCPNTVMMWFVQTLVLGYPSLRLLLKRSHDHL